MADAVYMVLRGGPDEAAVAVDGWHMVPVIRETALTLQVVGLMTVLPTGDLPLEVELSLHPGTVRYSIRIGLADEQWHSRSPSKRWTSVYLYATGARDAEWTWSEPQAGEIEDR